MSNPNDYAVVDLADLDAVTPTVASNIPCDSGRATLAQLAAVVFAQFNGGDAFVGKIAIGQTSKKLFIYCSDNNWHQLIPAAIDGLQMPTISEDTFNEIS